ncbi:LolA family protein [Herbiconiux sp. YIM B11900]|uniref:LolA family protein n=1 Tax=Herbiconiux sp. YIM B11900 TaxID=3404131 RepID=UPI003F84D37B
MATTAKWQRWVPAVAVPAVVGVVVAGGAFAAGASADLPEKTAQQVLELAAQADVQTFSGTVEQTSDLGLPDLSSVPGGSGSGGSSAGSGSGDSSVDSTVSTALELLTGSHSARVYADGPTKARVQVLDQLAERDAIRNGSDLWLYDSDDNTVLHSSIPVGEGADGSAQTSPEASGTVQTPAELAQGFLDAVDPSTDVSLGADTEVAGRSAYDLVLTPRGSETLVGSVSIAVDSETGMPLSVEVLARGASSPAFSVAFSSLSLDAPSDELFAFTPPEGAEVTEKSLPTDAGDGSGDHSAAPEGAGAHPEPVVTGEGWNTIVALPVGADTADLTSSPLVSQLLTPVDGGQVLQTALVSVLLTDDGRVLAGAVPAEALQSAAAGQ